MRNLRRCGVLAGLGLLWNPQFTYAQGPVSVVGIMSSPSPDTRQGVLLRCAWPDARPTSRLLFEGETACGRYTLLGVDGLSARLHDRVSGSELRVDVSPGPNAANSPAARLTPAVKPPVVATPAPPADVVPVRLSREQLDTYLRNPSAVLTGAVVQPVLVSTPQGPRIDGFEMRALPSNGLLQDVGLRAGDVLLELNGARLTGPAAVGSALEGLGASGHATALVRRGEARITFVVDLQ